jgi:hypothetical protein
MIKRTRCGCCKPNCRCLIRNDLQPQMNQAIGLDPFAQALDRFRPIIP